MYQFFLLYIQKIYLLLKVKKSNVNKNLFTDFINYINYSFMLNSIEQNI